MTKLQQELEAAFAALAAVAVSGDSVDRMAIARERLRRAYKLAGEAGAEPERETEAENDG